MRLLTVIWLMFSSSLVVSAAPPTLEMSSKATFSQKPFLSFPHGGTSTWLDDGKKAILEGKQNMDKWAYKGKEYIKQNGLLYEFTTHQDFQRYNLRITEPKLCDSSVKQYSGYLDGAEDKHLFFWFFEARNAPADAPLILWLNGGPGCSSSTGLLFELGPCSIGQNGTDVKHNPYSWNTNANMIFLDQPVNVGFSYSETNKSVSTSPAAAKDVYAFLELFLNRFPEYSKNPFHLAGESYGGTYAPNFASLIFKANKDLDLRPNPRIKHINLASVIIGNGLTEAYTQFGSVPEQICNGPYPVFDDPNGPECRKMRFNAPICQRMIKTCYKFSSKLTCTPALLYCMEGVWGPLAKSGRNLYDARRKCDMEIDGPLCYKEMAWIDIWLNDPSRKARLGVDPERQFKFCNYDVNLAWKLNGEGMHNSAALLPELVDAGVRLLVYNGNSDMLCNPVGGEQWVERMSTKFSEEFSKSESTPWIVPGSDVIAGEFRTAGGGDAHAGNITFVNVYEAGHMVPFDQPEAALDLIDRWIMNIPLAHADRDFMNGKKRMTRFISL